MRTKRIIKYKRQRNIVKRKFILLGIVVPISCVLVGYLITTIFILPSVIK